MFFTLKINGSFMESLQNPSLGTSVFNSIVHERLNVLPSAFAARFPERSLFCYLKCSEWNGDVCVWRNLQCFLIKLFALAGFTLFRCLCEHSKRFHPVKRGHTHTHTITHPTSSYPHTHNHYSTSYSFLHSPYCFVSLSLYLSLFPCSLLCIPGL